MSGQEFDDEGFIHQYFKNPLASVNIHLPDNTSKRDTKFIIYLLTKSVLNENGKATFGKSFKDCMKFFDLVEKFSHPIEKMT